MLVVDGYNFLHQWKDLANGNDVAGITAVHSMQDAREVVVRALEVYSQFRGVRVVVVFDALHSPQGGSRCDFVCHSDTWIGVYLLHPSVCLLHTCFICPHTAFIVMFSCVSSTLHCVFQPHTEFSNSPPPHVYPPPPPVRFTTQAAVEVVYSSDCEADTFIVTEVKRLLGDGVPYVLVATQDGVLSDCVRGNDQAWTMTHVLLHKELLRVCWRCLHGMKAHCYDDNGVHLWKLSSPGGAGRRQGAGRIDKKKDGADIHWQGAAAAQPRGV